MISATFSVYLLISAVPSFGGYGAVLWTLHPMFTLFGVLFCWPMGLLVYSLPGLSFSGRRTAHILLQSVGTFSLGLGYVVAYLVHEGKNADHLPFRHRDPTRLIHVLCGLLVLLLSAFQLFGGIKKAFFPTRPLPLAADFLGKKHSEGGPFLWLIACIVVALATLIRYNDDKWGALSAVISILLLCGTVVSVWAILLPSTLPIFLLQILNDGLKNAEAATVGLASSLGNAAIVSDTVLPGSSGHQTKSSMTVEETPDLRE